MNHPAIILILGAVLIFGYGLVSRLAERSPITAPMVFVAIGILDLTGDVGFKPTTPIEEGIPRFVKWYREFYQA